jgi:hypothetical protein
LRRSHILCVDHIPRASPSVPRRARGSRRSAMFFLANRGGHGAPVRFCPGCMAWRASPFFSVATQAAGRTAVLRTPPRARIARALRRRFRSLPSQGRVFFSVPCSDQFWRRALQPARRWALGALSCGVGGVWSAARQAYGYGGTLQGFWLRLGSC